MYLSTAEIIHNIFDRINEERDVIVTDGTVFRKIESCEFYDDVLSMNYTLDGILKCVEIHTDDFDFGKFGTTVNNGVLYVAPKWWIDI